MRKIIDLATSVAVLIAASRAAVARPQPSAATNAAGSVAAADTVLRSYDGGRGRTAQAPRDIPAAGWKDILLRVKDEMKDDNLTTIAGAMTYYGFLALFPALIAIVSLYGLIADPADLQRQLADVTDILPAETTGIVTDQLDSIVSSTDASLGVGFAISLIATFWTVSSGVSALIKAINLVFDEEETRSYLKRRLLALGLTVGLIVFVVATVFIITALPAVLTNIGLTESVIDLVSWLRWPALGIGLMIALAVFYRFAPNREHAKWRWVSWGAVAATVAWLVASIGLNVYVSNFGSYNETYGTLGGVIVLMLWMFVSSLIVLLGAELDAELEAQTTRDTTTGPPRPMGRRDAVKADKLGEPVGADA